LTGERSPLEPFQQRMYLARCDAQLGEKTAAENNWQRALEATGGDVQKLMTLAAYAEKNAAWEIADTSYANAIKVAPHARPAYEGRLRIAQAERNTGQIHAVLAAMLPLWPKDTAVQNDEAYTRLLLNPPATALQEIAATAEGLVEREPTSLPHRTLLALVRLRQNRPADALAVYDKIQISPRALTPSALAVHAAVLTAAGHAEDARIEQQQIPPDSLLPEEKALTASLEK
ncbi:MAG: hypothetical protein ABI992_08835, partial [Chthoniobacterales bacterium]